MPISGSVDFGALAVGDRPRRQAPRDLSPPPRPRKTPRFDPEVRRVSPPAHAVIHRRRALSPSPTIINLPDDAEPTLPPAFADSDDEDEGYVFVNRPRLDPPVRRYSTPALFGHPVAAPAVCKTARPVSPTTVNHASSITSSRRSSFAMSRPAFVSPSPDANSAKISSVDDAERRDFECLTSVLQSRYRASSPLTVSSLSAPRDCGSSIMSRQPVTPIHPHTPLDSSTATFVSVSGARAPSHRTRPRSRLRASTLAM